MITKNVKLYLGDGFPVRIPVSQFDTIWQFVFEIIHNSQPWQIPTGATAVLNGRKPDGNVFAFSGTIENNTVTVDADVQMTAVAGQTVCELSILANNKTVGTANFILDVEEAPKSADDVVSDTVLDGYGMMVTNAVDSWMNSHSGQIGGLTNEAKQALLALLEKVAYVDENGQIYLDALETALYPPADLLSISAVFNQGDNAIYDTDSLDTLKQYLTVTANMSDGTTQTVSNYTLSGTLAEGTSTITVSYGGKSTTFTVTVSADSGLPAGYQAVEYIAATNNNDYATTNIAVVSSDELEIRIAFMPTGNQSKTYGYPIGVRQSASTSSVGFGINVNKTPTDVATFGGTLVAIQPKDGASIVNEKIDIIATKTSTGASITDGTHTNTQTYAPRDANGNLRLFGIQAGSSNDFNFTGRIYYAKVYKNSTLAGDLVACRRTSDDVGGFYDKVNEAFYSDAGFVAGPDI